MQLTFLLSEKLQYLHVYKKVFCTKKRYGIKTNSLHSEFTRKLLTTNKKNIQITIVILEHIVRSLGKKVSDLKACTISLHPTSP